ncbi:MAG: hypothetical protein U5J99_13915 [Parvularculaceae bacterium]|nr:hypothetical protein [Parvularculaceae bacterium]
MKRGAAFAAALLALAPPADAAAPLTADLLPPSLLDSCEAAAPSFGAYAPPIAASVRALTDIGAVSARDFQGVRIGFCALKAAGGPVATAACADSVILLDDKYARADEALVLHATLAHEMAHHFQHRDKKAAFGEGYCESARYAADKPALEETADAFGDAVAELFVLGRSIEIFNACAAPVLVYLEAAEPVAVRGTTPAFLRVEAGAAALAPERALSGAVRFHARTAPGALPAFAWEDRAGPHARIVESRPVRLKEMRLKAAGRETGPFRLRLTCENASGRRSDR